MPAVGSIKIAAGVTPCHPRSFPRCPSLEHLATKHLGIVYVLFPRISKLRWTSRRRMSEPSNSSRAPALALGLSSAASRLPEPRQAVPRLLRKLAGDPPSIRKMRCGLRSLLSSSVISLPFCILVHCSLCSVIPVLPALLARCSRSAMSSSTSKGHFRKRGDRVDFSRLMPRRPAPSMQPSMTVQVSPGLHEC